MSVDADTPAQLAEAILQVARQAHTEEDLRIGVEKLLDSFLTRFGLRGSRYERTGRLGTRVDAQHGNLFIEYERPGKLAKTAGLKENTEQLQEQLRDAASRHVDQATAALRRMVGVGLDGEHILFVRYRGPVSSPTLARKLAPPQATLFPGAETSEFSIYGPHPVSPETIDYFLAYLQSVARAPLTPEALAETFGPKSDAAKLVVRLLYYKLAKSSNRRVQTFFAEWQRIFGIVYGQDIAKAEADARALGRHFGVKEALFTVATLLGTNSRATVKDFRKIRLQGACRYHDVARWSLLATNQAHSARHTDSS